MERQLVFEAQKVCTEDCGYDKTIVLLSPEEFTVEKLQDFVDEAISNFSEHEHPTNIEHIFTLIGNK